MHKDDMILVSIDDEIDKMTHRNAMNWYSFDPFRHIPEERATVGALRKAAEGHDVSIRALSRRETDHDADMAAFARRAAAATGTVP